ncbi:MAG: hypothetical protein C5B52_09445 [Bacteroidetes bacterium]|nr:MAG: hypothetical protein C5B52_09445 [Bacteroidota bacterium]
MEPKKGISFFKKSRVFVKSIWNNLFILTFLIGFLISSLIFIHMESTYESDLFQNVVQKIYHEGNGKMSADSFLVHAVHMTKRLMIDREIIFKNAEFNDIKGGFLKPATVDLATAYGSCGSYSNVLARILVRDGKEVRFAQMKVNGVYGGHILIEAKGDNGWVVLDPIYDLYFVSPDKHLASFEEVASNWNFYQNQVPADYNLNYNYSGVRYTNWNKIPIALPLVKKIISLFVGPKNADQISLRSYFLKTYETIFQVGLIFLILISAHTFEVFRRQRRFNLSAINRDSDISLLDQRIPA